MTKRECQLLAQIRAEIERAKWSRSWQGGIEARDKEAAWIALVAGQSVTSISHTAVVE